MYMDYNHNCDGPFEPKTLHTPHQMMVLRARCLLQAVEASTESDNHTGKRAADLRQTDEHNLL